MEWKYFLGYTYFDSIENATDMSEDLGQWKILGKRKEWWLPANWEEKPNSYVSNKFKA